MRSAPMASATSTTGRRARRCGRCSAVRVPELLDVGAGSGIFARQLLDAGVADGAVCVDPHYPAELSEERCAPLPEPWCC
jgi:hypothetical protein